jgi:hypothetical protein
MESVNGAGRQLLVLWDPEDEPVIAVTPDTREMFLPMADVTEPIGQVTVAFFHLNGIEVWSVRDYAFVRADDLVRCLPDTVVRVRDLVLAALEKAEEDGIEIQRPAFLDELGQAEEELEEAEAEP